MYEPRKDECPVLATYGLQNQCGIKVPFQDWNNSQEITVTMKKDLSYQMKSRNIVVQLKVTKDLDLNSFWRDYKLPDIMVCNTVNLYCNLFYVYLLDITLQSVCLCVNLSV